MTTDYKRIKHQQSHIEIMNSLVDLTQIIRTTNGFYYDFGLSFHQFCLYICHLASRIVST